MTIQNCKHEDFYYYLATNEEGWKCVQCGQPMPGEEPGYRPDLDRSHTYLKVGGILHDLHDQKFVYVSNGTGGDVITSMVADKCRETGRYDQYSILLFILEMMTPSHAKYWKEIGEGVISGNDKRDRCHCGKLSTISSGEGNYCSGEHAPEEVIF